MEEETNCLAVWDTRTQAALGATPAHTRPVTSLCYSSARQLLLSASTDRAIKAWVTGGVSLLPPVLPPTNGKVMDVGEEPALPAEENPAAPEPQADASQVDAPAMDTSSTGAGEPETAPTADAMATAPDDSGVAGDATTTAALVNPT